MALKWTKELETGYDRIDSQHEVLIQKLGEFKHACEMGRGRDVIVKMFLFIDNYVRAHFVLEESFMHSEHYPELEQHRAGHEALRQEYTKLLKVLAEDGVEPALVVRASVFLDDWWREHILKWDKRMVKYVKNQRKRQHRDAS